MIHLNKKHSRRQKSNVPPINEKSDELEMPYLNESKLEIDGLTANESSLDKALKSGSNYFSQR